MSSYQVPKTADERIADFAKVINDFNLDYAEFKAKQRKVSGHRARKALLSIAKLTRFIRKDIQADILTIKKSADETPETATVQPVVATEVSAPEAPATGSVA